MNDYKIIDDFLPSEIFTKIRIALLPSYEEVKKEETSKTPIEIFHPLWTYNPVVNHNSNKNWKLFYMFHLVYNHTILSPFYDILHPVCELLSIKSLIRIKCNLYPNTEIIKENGMHIDYPYLHKIAVLYINSCDGYTKFEDGTKIDSIANRMLIFDGDKMHTSSTTTNEIARCNINFNYF